MNLKVQLLDLSFISFVHYSERRKLKVTALTPFQTLKEKYK